MYRYVSFGLLLVAILFLAFVFYKVMAGFFLPLFLAALLVVVFRPLHRWFLRRVKGRRGKERPKLAAFLTTSSILLIVLLPFTLTVIFAAAEGRTVIRKLDPSTIDDKVREVRTKLALDMPAQKEFERIEKTIVAIQGETINPDNQQQRIRDRHNVSEISGLAKDLGVSLSASSDVNLTWDGTDEEGAEGSSASVALTPAQVTWQEFGEELAQARQMLSEDVWAQLADADEEQHQLSTARDKLKSSIDKFFAFKTKTLGGPIRSWLKEIANPNPEELSGYIQNSTTWLRARIVSLGGATTAFVGKFLFGTIIMALALFSFLLDGPAMLQAVKGLTPLDDQHEDELIEEFDKVSRAVVLATLISALAQGVLAAFGFYFAGLNAIILLMLLTSVLALVPFVGAAAVWVPASMYLMFVDGRMTAGIFLAIYGVAIISMADNVIKPLVLHGQSNLHPLWALLSVLGGVSALGPVGILVGPMIVAFLQTLLKILQREISSMDSADTPDAAST